MSDALLVTPYYEPNVVGGAEISVQLIAEGLPDRCDVLTFGEKDGLRTCGGVDIYEINFPVFTNLWAKYLDGRDLTVKNRLDAHLRTLFPTNRNVNRYLKFFKERKYETIIMNSNEGVMDRPSLWKAAHDSGARVILTLRDNLLLERTLCGLDCGGIIRNVVRGQLTWIDEIVAPSQFMIDLHAGYGMAKAKNRVIPNAVKDPIIRAVPFSEKGGVIFAGSISALKGVPTLIAASASFVGKEHLTLIGRGPLAKMVSNNKSITWIDWMAKDDLYQAMARAKVLVLPSEWPEAFGRVLIEAVCCGTLVVGSTAGGIPEVLANDERYLFKSGQAAELATKVNRILSLAENEYVCELRELKKKFTRFSVEEYISAWNSLIG